MPLDYKIIGSNVQNRRKELKITQQKMADDLFLSLSLISKLERGVKSVSLDTFFSIAEYLKTNIAFLTADPNEPKVQHNKLISEIDVMLEDLDNRQLHIMSQLMKTYMKQVQEIHPFSGETSDANPENFRKASNGNPARFGEMPNGNPMRFGEAPDGNPARFGEMPNGNPAHPGVIPNRSHPASN